MYGTRRRYFAGRALCHVLPVYYSCGIPKFLLPARRYLDLSYNQLTSSIPDGIYRFNTLQYDYMLHAMIVPQRWHWYSPMMNRYSCAGSWTSLTTS